MTRPPSSPDDELVPERLRARLLERASEIDARDTRVAELRAAAVEAGISATAFDAALAEIRSEPSRPTTAPATRGARRPWLGKLIVGLGVGALLVYFLGRMFVVPDYSAGPATTVTAPGAPTYHSEEYALGCLSSQEAIELIRPVLKDRANTISTRDGGPLNVGATAAQHREVQRLLESTCATRAADRVPPR